MQRLSFHRLAELELEEAAHYYESNSPGLGSKFLDLIEACAQSILAFPSSGRVIRGQIRQRLVRGFPYAIIAGRFRAAGAADRRDRHADRRHLDRRAAAVARRLPAPPTPLSAERHPVRGARRARRPHPLFGREGDRHRRQRVQHQGRVAAHRRLLGGRGARPARPAQRRDRAAVRRGGAAGGVGADRRPAVAGQLPGPGDLLSERVRARPR